MLQTKKSRIERTRDTVVYFIAVLGVILLIVARYIHDERFVLYGCVALLAALVATGGLAHQWAVHHGLSRGIRYAVLHSKMEQRLYQALYDCGLYVERVVLLKKCAMLPDISIQIDDSFAKGIVTIQNCIKYDKKLDELPISSALPDEYIITTSFISDDCNDYVYEFELYHLEQLRFNSYKDFSEYANRYGEYELFLDSRHHVTIHHTLIIGQTGSGKSYCLYNLILQMLSKPKPYELYIADPKYCGLYVLGTVVSKDYTATTVDEIIQLLKKFDNRMQDRKQEFCKKLLLKLDSDYRDFGLQPICLIIDEYSAFRASLSRYDKKTRDFVDEIIGNVIREGRQLGCFCIISQQQSNATNLPTELKENMPCKIILGMAERQTYMTALGVYPDVARRNFECGQGLLVYPQIANPETPAVTSVATLSFDILEACKEQCMNNKSRREKAGVM